MPMLTLGFPMVCPDWVLTDHTTAAISQANPTVPHRPSVPRSPAHSPDEQETDANWRRVLVPNEHVDDDGDDLAENADDRE